MPTRNATIFIATTWFLLALYSCQKSNTTTINTSEPDYEVEDSIPITMTEKAVTEPVGNAVEGYYVGLPSNYNQTNRKYPLLLFLPGAGQIGNGSNELWLLLQDGPAKLIHEGRFPTKIKMNGKTFNFIVFTPQPRWYPSTASMFACLEYAKSKFRVDPNRIYISGISMGGILACDMASEAPLQMAAIVPLAGVSRDYDVKAKCKEIAEGKVPIWAFHCTDDNLFDPSLVTFFISGINSFNPAIKPKITWWPNGGHDAWGRAVEPSYRENGMNMYEWMLQYRR